jgi:hypothetical protein
MSKKDNIIWRFFGDKGTPCATYCLHCEWCEPKNTSSSTTNLWRHLETTHHLDAETLKTLTSSQTTSLHSFASPPWSKLAIARQKLALVFPITAKMAYKYLLMQASEADVERNYSHAGHIFEKRRSALSAKNLNMILFLYENRSYWENLTDAQVLAIFGDA